MFVSSLISQGQLDLQLLSEPRTQLKAFNSECSQLLPLAGPSILVLGSPVCETPEPITSSLEIRTHITVSLPDNYPWPTLLSHSRTFSGLWHHFCSCRHLYLPNPCYHIPYLGLVQDMFLLCRSHCPNLGLSSSPLSTPHACLPAL